MTKTQIKAELRRSALYSADPFWDVGFWNRDRAREFLVLQRGQNLSYLSDVALRTFYLLVAEAIDE